MPPTILDGDTVTVRFCNDGAAIKAGPINSSNPGDIIVYGVIAAMAYIPEPNCMWICHRAVSKYYRDGTWYFKTQGDDCSEPDKWEVPEYYILGVVVQITHNRRSAETRGNNGIPMANFYPLAVFFELLVGLMVGILFGFAFIKVYVYLQKALRLNCHELAECTPYFFQRF